MGGNSTPVHYEQHCPQLVRPFVVVLLGQAELLVIFNTCKRTKYANAVAYNYTKELITNDLT